MPNDIRISGIESTVARIQQIGGSTRSALLKGAVYLRGVLATYPPARRLTRRSVYGQPFVSDRQRRFFFAGLRDGRIRVPYVRTRNLGHRWTVRADSDTQATVGNNAAGARYVMDEQKQSRFARAIGWRSAQEAARKEKAAIVRVVEADLKAQLRRR